MTSTLMSCWATGSTSPGLIVRQDGRQTSNCVCHSPLGAFGPYLKPCPLGHGRPPTWPLNLPHGQMPLGAWLRIVPIFAVVTIPLAFRPGVPVGFLQRNGTQSLSGVPRNSRRLAVGDDLPRVCPVTTRHVAKAVPQGMPPARGHFSPRRVHQLRES